MSEFQNPSAATPMTATAHDAGASLTPNTGSDSRLLGNSYNAGADGAASGGLLSGVTQTGAPVAPSQLTPESIVTVRGLPVSVKIAEAQGLIVRDAAGGYREAGAAAQPPFAADAPQAPADEQRNTPADEPAQPSAVALDGDAEQVVSTFTERTSPQLQVAAVTQMIKGGELSPHLVNEAAQQMGHDPQTVRSMIETARAAMEQQAIATVAGVAGVANPEDVFAWAHSNAPQLLRGAMEAQAYDRSPAKYADVARAYVENLDTANPALILNAEFGGGISAAMVGRTVVLNIPNVGAVPYREALARKLIRVS